MIVPRGRRGGSRRVTVVVFGFGIGWVALAGWCGLEPDA